MIFGAGVWFGFLFGFSRSMRTAAARAQSPPKNKNATGWVFLAIGILSFLLALAFGIQSTWFLKSALPATGVVIGYGPRFPGDQQITNFAPMVTFRDFEGIEHTFVSRVASSNKKFVRNAIAPVLYLPGAPERAEIDGFEHFWSAPIGFGFAGAICLSVGIVFRRFGKWPISWKPAWLPLLLLLAGCASPKAPVVAEFRNCNAITNGFRGFHQQSFPTNWVCENGILRSIKGPGTDLITREKFKDFELELDWKVTRGANSGVIYGVSEATDESFWSGPEMQINDDPNHKDGQTPNRSAGSLYDLMAPNEAKKLFRTGEWNHVRLVIRKGHVEHWLNAAKLLEYDWNSDATRALIAKSKFASAPHFMKERNGHIALQHHGDEVHFRNIRIKRF